MRPWQSIAGALRRIGASGLVPESLATPGDDMLAVGDVPHEWLFSRVDLPPAPPTTQGVPPMPSSPLTRGQATVRGLLAAALGTTLMVWPGITIGTVVALFAIFAFADAVLSTVQVFRSGESPGERMLLGIRALIEVGAGIAVIAYPGITAAIMTVIVGIYAVTAGGLELAVVGRLAQAGVKPNGWAIAGGVLAVMTGVALVVWPGIGAVTLAIVFGAYLAVAGVVLLIQAAVTPRGATVVPSHA